MPKLLLIILAAIFGVMAHAEDTVPPLRALWISAYYPGWQREVLKPPEIDFSAMTHLIHFSAIVRADGMLNFETHQIGEEQAREIVAAGRKAQRPVLLCVGGGETGNGFQKAIGAAHREVLIAHLIEAVKARGYDGLDLDMEPIQNADMENYSAFVRALRTAMKEENDRWLLTAATGDMPGMFAAIQNEFDQINVMTYELSGPWDGWVTWHGSALTNGGLEFPQVRRPLPCVAEKMSEWIKAGIKPEKLGMGLAFFATAWHGAKAPNESIAGVKLEQLSYEVLMQKYFKPERYHWHEAASVPYLSIDAVDAKDRLFISYEDERSLGLKIDYARKPGLGGAIIWELGIGSRRTGERNPLLQTVEKAAFGK